LYDNLTTLLEMAEERQDPLWKIILENEMQLRDVSEEDVFKKLDQRYEVMLSSANKALNKPQETAGNLIKGMAKQQFQYSNKDDTFCGTDLNRVMAFALSSSEVNASMGKICASPTAGSCGILPAVLISVSEKYQLPRVETLRGLLTASGIGAVIMKNATVSGAVGGCQAECGVAAAMAAAAAVEMRKGTPKMALNACSLALVNVMGLVCDPIAGLVQIPCAQRNASQAVNAMLSADMAMAGMDFIIPPDQVVEAMYRVGKQLPSELKETAMGGLAVTPAGKEIARQIYGENE
jgi:L-serine dehydratase